MRKEKTHMKFVLSASLALASWVALAGVSENFEGATAISGTWTNQNNEAVTPAAATHAGTIAVGTAINTTAGYKVVNVCPVSGTVVCDDTGTTAGDAGSADFAMFVEEAGDEPDADDTALSGAQIAVAGGPCSSDDTKSTIYVYCKTNATHCGWIASDKSIATGTWYRVSLNFDYTNGRCEVCFDGEPVESDFGYLKSSGDTTRGAWYRLATETGNDNIAQLAFVGSTEVDDVVVTGSALDTTRYAGYKNINGVAVSNNYLVAYAVNANSAATKSLDDSGLTLLDKFETGLDPTDNSTFTATAMTLVDAGKTATITIPCHVDNGQSYTIVVTDGTKTREVTPTVGDISGNSRMLSFTMPSDITGKVVKYTVKATGPSASAN